MIRYRLSNSHVFLTGFRRGFVFFLLRKDGAKDDTQDFKDDFNVFQFLGFKRIRR